MAGETGAFNVLDMRSHRIPRVCRSSYAAETLGTEEAFDVGQLCRGFLATARGHPMHGKTVDTSINSVPLTVVTANMFVDAGTKEMDLTHLRSIFDAGKWSVTYSPRPL